MKALIKLSNSDLFEQALVAQLHMAMSAKASINIKIYETEFQAMVLSCHPVKEDKKTVWSTELDCKLRE